MTDYAMQFEIATKEAVEGSSNRLYNIALFWAAATNGVEIGMCNHDDFVKATHDARELTDIIKTGFVISESAQEEALRDFTKRNVKLTSFNTLRLSEELEVDARSAERLIEIFDYTLRNIASHSH